MAKPNYIPGGIAAKALANLKGGGNAAEKAAEASPESAPTPEAPAADAPAKKSKVKFKAGGLAAKAAAAKEDGGAAEPQAAKELAVDDKPAPAKPVELKPRKYKIVSGGIAAVALENLKKKLASPATKAAAPKPAKPASSSAAAETKKTAVGASATAPRPVAVKKVVRKADPTKATKKAAPRKPVETLPPPPVLQARRTFIEYGIVAWLVFFAWLSGIGHMFTRFMFPRVLYEPDPKFRAGKRSDFPELGKVYEDFKETRGVWLVRLTEEGEDHLVALSTICTHLGCTPNWLGAEAKFKCPCHGSGFYKTGENFEGPAPRPLERFRIFVDPSGAVIIDRGVKFRSDLGQWGQAESFIKMA